MAIPGEKPWANSHLILERQEEKRTVPETVENDVTYSPSKKKKKKLNTMEYFINIVQLH